MKTLYKIFLSTVFTLVVGGVLMAGNPDRQGQAGAAELLLNPWARSAGLHSMNTSTVSGIEAMRLNIAGLSRLNNKELVIANARLYEGSDVSMSALGYGNKIGTNGSFGVTITSMNFGDIPITTENRPEGTGGTFSPSFFNMGLGYSYLYDNKVSVGLLVRAVSESLADANAFGFAIDAGVQYVAGDQDNFRLGISLRNVGSSMSFSGEGLAFSAPSSNGDFEITTTQRAQEFEMPSTLNIGLSYDFYFGGNNVVVADDTENPRKAREFVLRAIGNFTSNAFSRDQIGVGAEFIFNDMFFLRAAYREEIGGESAIQDNVYTGLSFGGSVEIPFTQAGSNRIGLDYAYRTTDPFEGSHNFSIRLLF